MAAGRDEIPDLQLRDILLLYYKSVLSRRMLIEHTMYIYQFLLNLYIIFLSEICMNLFLYWKISIVQRFYIFFYFLFFFYCEVYSVTRA